MANPTGYSRLQILLHWLVAILIFAAFFTHDAMEDAFEARLASGATGIEGNTLHVWFGGAVFALVLLRLIVRWVQGAPGPVPGTSPLMELAARWGHRLLYLLMLAVPIGGSIAWYGGVEAVGEGHEIAGKALMIVAVGHAVVAIGHEALKGDGVLMRMVRPSR